MFVHMSAGGFFGNTLPFGIVLVGCMIFFVNAFPLFIMLVIGVVVIIGRNRFRGGGFTTVKDGGIKSAVQINIRHLDGLPGEQSPSVAKQLSERSFNV